MLRLVEEQISVERRTIQGPTVRIATATHVREQQIEEELARETVTVERVTVDRLVLETPPIREDGNVTIIPVMEEVLVLERRLVLKEEIWIRRLKSVEMHRETVQLREQTATITRTEPRDAPAGAIQHPV